MTMRKKLLITVALMTGVTAFAQSTVATTNAICVTLKNGDTRFAAFTQKPVITSTDDGKLKVTSAADNAELLLADLNTVQSITATSHDFSTNVTQVSNRNDASTEFYNIDGTKATVVVPGKIYIIKNNGITKKTIK